MDSSHFRCLIVLLGLHVSLCAKQFNEKELAEIGISSLARMAEARGHDEKRKSLEQSFAGLADEQRIRAVFLAAMASENDPRFRMSGYYSILHGLNRNPEWASDWSSLRKMLRTEKDPRRFYILSRMVPHSNGQARHDFVAERAHMLFADGRVAKEEGEYTQPYAHDVSEYAYTVIVGNLRALSADFKPPTTDPPHPEQALILARWLKANWPGCEDLQLPEVGRNQKQRVSGGRDTGAGKRSDGRTVGGESLPQARSFHWFWPGALVVLAAAIFGWIKVRKR